MADQSSQRGAGQAAPPSEAAPQAHAAAQDAAESALAARPPLGEWRGPVFWMACGALLAGLATGVIALVQRVGVERDMMAVAATLPQAGSQAASAPVLPAVARPPPGADTGAAPSSTLALPPSASQSAPGPAARGAQSVATRVVRRHVPPRPSAMAVKLQAQPGKQARRMRVAADQKYAGVFKRCPASGLPGALQCRRDICNGAERKGPACKPYIRKRP